MKGIAIIPARGGSKRIPHKNIKDFNGKPLIAYSIEAALNSKIFSEVIVSTDDEEIKEVALKYGALVPFMRDKNLADDFTGTFDVTRDAFFKCIKDDYEFATCIYATAPLLTPKYLQDSFDLFKKDNVDYLYSCCEYPFPIQRSCYLENNTPTPFMPDCMLMRSQDLKKAYQDAGQFYFYKKRYLENTNIDNLIKRVFIMPRHRVIDIDTMEDFDIARAMAKVVMELNLD